MFQVIINYIYRFPKSNWNNIQRFGGFLSYYRMLKNKREMNDASKSIPPVISFEAGLKIHILTGKNHFYQTLFCAYSLIKVTKDKIQFVLIDDGSLDEKFILEIKKKMPNVKLILKETIKQNLNCKLPIAKFPYLHHKRIVYQHIKKLTDIHTNNIGYKLVLDSDMLFWKEPTDLINWLKNPIGCLYMLDSKQSYGYDTQFMQSLCGYHIPELVNVGVLGFNSEIINWNSIENWSKMLESEHGASYFLEQALSAMLIANEEKYILNREKYIVNPRTYNEDDILHHYVDLSKKYYFETAWKKLLE